MEIFKIIILSLSGLLLLFVGIMRLSNPIGAYLKNSGINLPSDTDLLNEMRGVSSVMLLGGVILLLGIVAPSVRQSSFMVGVLLFIGFAIGRIISIGIDGKPNKQIVQGIISELILGAANIVCLISTME